MIQKIKIFIFLIFTSSILISQNDEFKIEEFYPIEKSHSYIGFSVKYMGYAMVRGRFENYNGTFRYDENDISKTSISLSIDSNSIDTDHNWRDKDLKSKDWFDVEKFPKILFVSQKALPTSTGFEITGELTIKDVTKEVVVRMDTPSGILNDIRGDSQVILTGELTIDRTDFGVEGEKWSSIKEGITAVSENVNIEVSILGKQMNLNNLKNWVSDTTKPTGKIYKAIADNGAEEGLRVFEELMTNKNERIDPRTLNTVGLILLKEGNTNDALKIFRKNIETYPKNDDAYDYYANGLAVSGDLKNAKFFYQKAIENNTDNQNAMEILRHLE